jgi:hypothetical protein
MALAGLRAHAVAEEVAERAFQKARAEVLAVRERRHARQQGEERARLIAACDHPQLEYIGVPDPLSDLRCVACPWQHSIDAEGQERTEVAG